MNDDTNRTELPGPWLDTNEAAEYTRFSPNSLRTFRSKGRGPKYHKAGKAVRYHLDDLDAFVRGEARDGQ